MLQITRITSLKVAEQEPEQNLDIKSNFLAVFEVTLEWKVLQYVFSLWWGLVGCQKMNNSGPDAYKNSLRWRRVSGYNYLWLYLFLKNPNQPTYLYMCNSQYAVDGVLMRSSVEIRASIWLKEVFSDFEGQKLDLLFRMYSYLLYLQGWPVQHNLMILF